MGQGPAVPAQHAGLTSTFVDAMADEPPTPAVPAATYVVEGMSCASCVSHVEAAIAAVPGVEGVAVNLVAGQAQVGGSRA